VTPPTRSSAPRTPHARTVAIIALGLVAALGMAACGSAGPTATPSATASPASAPSPTPAVTPGTAPTPAAPSATPAGGALVLDESLLDVIPAEVNGITPIAAPETFDEVRNDPGLAENVEAIAFFVVASPGDLASGSVSRLRDGVFGDGFWRDWRDTYDAGACAQAGGVTGNAEAEIGGRTTYITSCAGGLYVYHVHLPERGVIVSLFSVGPARLGEAVMAGLRP
jgi:hypothetical protein